MNIDDVTPEELINLRNIAERESFNSGKEVLFQDILIREYALSLHGLSKYISKKSKVDKKMHLKTGLRGFRDLAACASRRGG